MSVSPSLTPSLTNVSLLFNKSSTLASLCPSSSLTSCHCLLFLAAEIKATANMSLLHIWLQTFGFPFCILHLQTYLCLHLAIDIKWLSDCSLWTLCPQWTSCWQYICVRCKSGAVIVLLNSRRWYIIICQFSTTGSRRKRLGFFCCQAVSKPDRDVNLKIADITVCIYDSN